MNNQLDLSAFFQRFSSRALWHFTGYNKSPSEAFDRLNSILSENCLRIAPNPELIHMPDGKSRLGYRIACSCDIPFSDLRIHIYRYGPVGIAFHKQAAIVHGLFNPVLYLHKDSPVFKLATTQVSQLEQMVKVGDPIHKPLQQLLTLIGSYAKNTDLVHPAVLSTEKDISQENNFYFEREWRTIQDWNFDDSAIAAIMVPSEFLSDFRRKWGDRFSAASIISSEMVGTL